MPSEWLNITLGDFLRLQRGHDLTESERHKGHVPVMGSAGQNGFHNEAKAPGPGVVIGRSGASMGRVHYCSTDYWPHNTTLYVTDFLGNNPKFAYYFLQTLDLAGFNSGSAQPSLNRNYIYGIKISVPEREEQNSIAATLSALDDKIALLRETNATLEAIAQAMFKSWFVDFDPVRAKAEGRDPEGVPPEVADLFPSEFEASELGAIPKGWRVGRLGDVLRQRVDRTKPSAKTEQLPYVPIECITSKSVFLVESKPGIEAQSSLTLFSEGDIIFGAMRPYFHKVFLAPFDGVTRTTAFVLTPTKPEMAMFALFQMFHDRTIEFATNHSEGSTIPYAKWVGSMENMGIVVPPDDVAAVFGEIVDGLMQRGIQNTEQSQSLAELRDTLLPRLMSGKVRIPHERVAS